MTNIAMDAWVLLDNAAVANAVYLNENGIPFTKYYYYSELEKIFVNTLATLYGWAENTTDPTDIAILGLNAVGVPYHAISDDGGLTWSKTALVAIVPATLYTLIYIDDVIWFVANNGGAYKLHEGVGVFGSTDRKNITFAQAQGEKGIYYDGHFYYHNATHLYKVQLSAPYTETQIVALGMSNLVRVSDDLWYALEVATGDVIKSTDHGGSWTDCNDAIDDYTPRCSDGTYLYLTAVVNNVMRCIRTDDDGATIEYLFTRAAQDDGTSNYIEAVDARIIGGTTYITIKERYLSAAGTTVYNLYNFQDIGNYIMSSIINNAVNPTEPRTAVLQMVPEVAEAFCPDLIYTISDSTPAEKFKGYYFSHTPQGVVTLIGIDREIHMLSASSANAAKKADEIIDVLLAKLVNCTAGSTDAAAATTYTQTFTDQTILAQGLNTYGRIGLGLIAVQSDSSIDFDLLSDLPASGRTLNGDGEHETLLLRSVKNQNTQKYDKVIVVGARDDTEALQKTLGSGSHAVRITRLDLHDKLAVDDFCAGIWAVVGASEQISRIYEIEEWNATWMEVGSTCILTNIPSVPYGTYIVLSMQYDLAINRCLWRFCQTVDIKPLVNDITNNLVAQGLSDSAGGGTPLANLNTLQDLSSGNFKTAVTLPAAPTAALHAATKAYVDAAYRYVPLDGNDENGYNYIGTSATNGGNVVLDLINGTSTETNVTQASEDWTTVVPSTAKAVHLLIFCQADTANTSNRVSVMKNGTTNLVQRLLCSAGAVANYLTAMAGNVTLDANGKVNVVVGRGAGTITFGISILGYYI